MLLSLKSYPAGSDEWLRQAVVISVFTDARADESEQLRDGDRRGYWGDMLNNGDESFSLGSLLWLLHRETLTQNTVNRARDYVRDCLSWLIDTTWVNSIAIEVEAHRPSILAFQVELKRERNQPPLLVTFDIDGEVVNAA